MTVVVIAVAIAFLMNVLSEGLLKGSIRRMTSRRIAEERRAAVWAARLSVPGTIEEIIEEVAGAEEGGPAWEAWSNPLVVSYQLTSMWGESSDDIYVVGRDEMVLHFDGGAWTILHSGGEAALNDVWSSPSGDIFTAGAGGAQLFIAEDSPKSPGERVNHRRFEEVTETGASTVAVACPYCPIMLSDAAQHAGREDIRVLDVAELVAQRLE